MGLVISTTDNLAYAGGWSKDSKPAMIQYKSAPNAVAAVSGLNHLIVLDGDNNLWGRRTSCDCEGLCRGHQDAICFPITDWEGGKKPRITAIDAVGSYSLLLDDTGRLWFSGESPDDGWIASSVNFRPLAFPPLGERVTKVSTGNHHILALNDRGQVWSWGINKYGQLGNGRLPYQQARMIFTKDYEIVEVVITDISAGATHSLMLDDEGHVWGCGSSSSGELGPNLDNRWFSLPQRLELESSQVTKISAGDRHSIVLDKGGRVWVAGTNRAGQLGLPTATNCKSFTHVPLPSPITEIRAGEEYSAVIDEEGRLWLTGKFMPKGPANTVVVPARAFFKPNTELRFSFQQTDN